MVTAHQILHTTTTGISVLTVSTPCGLQFTTLGPALRIWTMMEEGGKTLATGRW